MFFRILSLSKHTFSTVLVPLQRPWGAHPTPLWTIKQLWYHCLNPPCSLTHGAKLSPSSLPQLLGCSQLQAQPSRPQGLCTEENQVGQQEAAWPWQWMDSSQSTHHKRCMAENEWNQTWRRQSRPETGQVEGDTQNGQSPHGSLVKTLQKSLYWFPLHAHNPPAFSLGRLIKFQAGVYGYKTACLTYTKIN